MLLIKRIVSLIILLGGLCLTLACGGKSGGPVRADATEGVCPVCQMKVKSTDPTASEVIFSDGNKLMFETAGDMMFFFLSEYDKDKPSEMLTRHGEIKTFLMKDYNSKNYIDARQATLVYKSKVNGPMGPEVFAFENEEDAKSFAQANGGALETLYTISLDEIRNLRKR